MPSSRTARPSKQDVWVNCGRYFLRTIKREDASDRWASWLNDPWTIQVLNTAPRKMVKSDIADYIKQFDQRTRLLLGIFERGTRLHVGVVRLDIDYVASQALVNAVIGEAEHRNRGATTDVFVPILDLLFDSLDIARVKASILERNRVTLRYLLKLGWQRDAEPEAPMKSLVDGSTLQRCSVSWTRDAYRAFRQTPAGKRILERIARVERPAARGAQ